MRVYTPRGEIKNLLTALSPALTVPAGLIDGYSSVNKFGRSTNVDSGVDTDIHDGANSTDDVAIWVAPTQARTHQIVSTSADDDGDPAGIGLRTLRVYGLTSWDADEVSEDITMNGMTNVATANQYVIIHRMEPLTWGSAGPNVGVITATADTDATVTAQINAGEGQTQMAIYGVPSTKRIYLCQYYASALKAAISLSASIKLLVNTTPDSVLTAFITKHTNGVATEGTSYLPHRFEPFARFDGPCIIKLQANSSSNDTDISAGFDAYLEAVA